MLHCKYSCSFSQYICQILGLVARIKNDGVHNNEEGQKMMMELIVDRLVSRSVTLIHIDHILIAGVITRHLFDLT